MRIAAMIVSVAALAGTIAPSLLFFVGRLGLDATKSWMLAATVCWFVATPVWMGRQR